MATLPVYDLGKNEVGTIDVQDEVFGAEVNRHLFYEVIKWQLAKRRQGTACTKGRSEVRGGGAKPYRQKGTGRARQGSRRAPNHVGGGTVHGPKPRSYEYNLNKKVRRGAIRSALSLRVSQDKLIVLRDLELESAKTKAAAKIFEVLANSNALIIDTVQNRNLELSVRNLPKVKLLDIDGVNLFDLLKHEYLVVTEPTVRKLEGALSK
jgi:large subunit ribosomal protein L4